MSQQIVNAAPMVIDYGTEDLSTRLLPREPEAIPQHLAKFYIFAQKGPTDPQLVSGNERDLIFGSDTFLETSKFFNHATAFANLANKEGNPTMLQRLVPDDAGPESNMIVWLDVLPTLVDLYERNTDGSIKLDLAGDPTILGTAAGYKVKWVVTHHSTKVAAQDFGLATIGPGDQTDPDTLTQSQRYPIFELKVSSQGEAGNNVGIRLWAPTLGISGSVPTRMMAETAAYPYNISVIRKATALAAPDIVPTLFNEKILLTTFKPGIIDPLTEAQLYIGDIFTDAYQNLTDLRYPKRFGEFGAIKVYDANIDLLLGMFHTAEVPFIDEFSDFSSLATDKHLFNFVTGVSSFDVPYHSFVFVDSVTTVRFSQYTNVFAAGGSDGTMTDVIHADLASIQMLRYLDPLDPVQDLVVNPESIMYDSGYPLDAKYAMCAFISVRKDTMVVTGVHDVAGPELTADQEHSIAVALRTRLQMFPESDYFGTPTMRGMIVGQSGKLRNSKYIKRLPLTAEVLIKAARYMGAGNGKWKNGFHFDAAPGSIVENMYDINNTWVPASVRNRNWDAGLNWVQAYDRRSFFFPALKTVYENDTSVLNSFFTVMAICYLNKVAHSAWREFTGTSHLTNAQLAERVNDFVINNTQHKFDDRFVIRPEAFFTDMDLLRGFSWTLPIKIYAPNMKTVMTTYVQAFRAEDLQAQQ